MAITNPFKGLSKNQRYVAIGGVTLVAGFLVFEHHKKTGSWNPWSQGSQANAASGGQIDPVTGMAYSQDNVTDPITGLTYLAEAEQYGSVATAEAAFGGYGGSVATGSGYGVQPASGGSVAGTLPTAPGSAYANNQDWVQAVQAGLTAIGYDENAVNQALQLYLGGQPLTPSQVALVNVALAEFGQPPNGSFQIIHAPSSGPSTTPPPGGGTPPPPGGGVDHGPVPPPATKVANYPAGIRVAGAWTAGKSSSAKVTWQPVKGATGYAVHLTYQGASVDKFNTHNTYANFGGLTPNHTYTVHVATINGAGTGPESNGPSFKTPR